jgi:hypothetical protein
MIFELAAANRVLEVLETLEPRGDLGDGELESLLQMWVNGAPDGEVYTRHVEAGEVLLHCAAGPVNRPKGTLGNNRYMTAISKFLDQPCSGLAKIEKLDESQTDCLARALLARARCRKEGDLDEVVQNKEDGNKAISMLEKSPFFGRNHPETCTARSAWRLLDVADRNP